MPGRVVALDTLRPHVAVQDTFREPRDVVNLRAQSREAQERRLLGLIEAGRRVAAIQLARSLYSYDLVTATAFIERVRSERGKRGVPSSSGYNP